MATSHKALLSLLISLLLFGAFTALAFTGLFDLLETHFYNPSIVASINRDNARNTEIIDTFFTEMENLFAGVLRTETVRRGFQADQNADGVNHPNISAVLSESLQWAQWVRFIDSGGVRIHFSSYEPDIQRDDGRVVTYQNYRDADLPYEEIAVEEGAPPKYTFDERAGRILFSFPMYDSFDIYWGTALFALPANAVTDRLVSEGRIRFGQDFSVIADPPGLLFEAAAGDEKASLSQISSTWKETGAKTVTLVSRVSGHSLVMFSAQSGHGFFVGRLVNEEIFSFSDAMKIILLVSFFITVFLIVFLLFSFRQDPVTVVQNRLKKLQIALIEQFYELRGETDWARWVRELENRRDEVTVHLKDGVKITTENENSDIDLLIKKSWDELLLLLGKHREEGIEEEKLKSILKRLLADLAETNNIPQLSGRRVSGQDGTVSGVTDRHGLLMRAAAIVKEIEETDLVEELEEADEVETWRPQEDEVNKEEEPDISGVDIAYLASKIEFGPDSEPESSGEEIIEQDLEIVSPFSSMMFDFSDSPRKSGKDEGSGVIKEKDGVHYISGDARNPGSEASASLDKNFKDLVDSVIK